jgi:hypothetical protein
MKKILLLFFVSLLIISGNVKGQLYNMETFDSNPATAEDQAAGVWYVDRYAPAAFESYDLNGENVLRLGIDVNDGAPNRGGQSGTFYNTHGRKFDLANDIISLKGSLYIPADWETKHRRSGLWATAFDASDAISYYPIISFRNTTGSNPTFSYYNGTTGDWVDVSMSIIYDSWYEFKMVLAGSDILYYINGNLVGTLDNNNSAYLGNIIVQAYNFNDPALDPAYYDNSANATYDAYWDNIGTSNGDPIVNFGVPETSGCGTLDVPVTVQDFNDVGSISLKLNYNDTELTYTGIIVNSAISGASYSEASGEITFGQFSSTGATLADGDVLFTMHFTVVPDIDGTPVNISWDDDVAGNCELAGPGGTPVYTSTFNDLNTSVITDELPEITCPADITVNNETGQCGAVVTYTAPVGTDNCPNPVTTQIAGLASGSLFPVGTTTNTFEVTDSQGNTATCSFTVTVNDTEAPEIADCGAQVNLSVGENCEVELPDVTASVDASDNCTPGSSGYEIVNSGSINFNGSGGWAGWSLKNGKVVTGGGFQLTGGPVATSAPGLPGVSYPNGYTYDPNEYGWVVQDANTKVASPGSNIYVIYDDMPAGYEVISHTISGFNSTGWAGWSAPAGKVVLGGGFEADGPVKVSAPAGPNTVWEHYTYSNDEYGWVIQSAGATSVTIFVICADEPAGYEIVKSSQLNFSGTGWAGWSVSGKKVLGGGFECSNPVRASRPSMPNETTPSGYPNGPNEYGWVVQSDNVGGPGFIYVIYADPAPSLQVTQDPVAGTKLGPGTHTVTITVTDAAGNSETCTKNVVVTDDTAPTLTCVDNQNRGTDAPECTYTAIGVEFDLSAQDDNCGITGQTYELTGATIAGPVSATTLDGVVFNKGVTTVTWTLSDDAGNENSCSFDVEVVDNDAPNAVCQPVTVYLDGTCSASIIPADVDGGSTDNCGVASLSVSQETFTAADLKKDRALTIYQSNTSNLTHSAITLENTTGTTITEITVNYDMVVPWCRYDNSTLRTAKLIWNLDGNGVGTSPQLNNSLVPAGKATTWLTNDEMDSYGLTARGEVLTISGLSIAPGDTYTLGFGNFYDNGSKNMNHGIDNLTISAGSTVLYENDFNTEINGWTTYLQGTATPIIDVANTSDWGGVWSGYWTYGQPAGTEVTLSVTDDAGNVSTCNTMVTVIDNTAPTIDECAENKSAIVTDGCSAAVPDFTAEVDASDVCGDVTITQDPVAGTYLDADNSPHTITITVTDESGNTTTCTALFTVNKAVLSGTLVYNNNAQTPMNLIYLELNPGGLTTTTDEDGYYEFTGLCAGTYTISIISNAKDVGYINATDAGAVNKWSSVGGAIEYVNFLAGDVAGPDLWLTGAQDALMIQNNFVYGTSFDRAPWSYFSQNSTINSNSDANYSGGHPAGISVIISGADVVNNMFGLATGDFNGSFTPTNTKSAHSSLALNTDRNLQVEENMQFELPLRAKSSMEVGAISMILDIPADLVEVQAVKVAGSNEPVSWAVKDNELRIGWNSLNPVYVKSNEQLVTLMLKSTESFGAGRSADIDLVFNPLNELADGNFNVIPDATLLVARAGNGLVNVAVELETDNLTFSNFPNPFTGSTTLKYSLPVDGKVNINVYNQLGQLVTSVLNENQRAGLHTIPNYGNNLVSGIYIAKLSLTNEDTHMISTIKLKVVK